MVSNKQFYNPQLTRSKIYCLVDDNLSIHALRCGKNSLDDPLEMQTIEYAFLSLENSSLLQWQALTPTIFHPAFPILVLGKNQIFALVVGLLKNDKDSARYLRYYAHCWSIGNEFLDTYPQPLNSSIKAAITKDEKLLLVSTNWVPPVAINISRPLILASYENNQFSMLANPIVGTDVAGSFPSSIAIYTNNKNEIHLVYDGYYQLLQDDGLHLWHLKLAANGEILATEDLGLAPKFPLISEIITSPDGSIYLLIVYFDELTRQTLEHKLIKILGEDLENSKVEHYFIDNWLQIHSVWFDNNQAYYYGPDKISIL
ncbi:MAG: hypothetical protein HY819_24290 [Acidobacteria bacterium]|nr:hypothetical protein [Acidobacteriota bacterium]